MPEPVFDSFEASSFPSCLSEISAVEMLQPPSSQQYSLPNRTRFGLEWPALLDLFDAYFLGS